MSQAGEQFQVAMQKAGESVTAIFRAAILVVVAACHLTIRGLDVLDTQLQEHQR